MQTKLSITALSKSFASPDARKVLDNINLEVAAGEFVSLIGPSGSGKSTLLHIVSGVDEPTSGTIAIGSGSGSGSAAGRLGASGYVMQRPLLLPWKTVRENIMLGPVLRHHPATAAAREAERLLKDFGLDAYAGAYPATLSGGMAQRVALLRTIMAGKDFLLLDEPFGALDALTRQTMQLWLLDVWSRFGSTVVCVTHDIREAILLSDKVYVLNGRPATIVSGVEIDLPRPRRREHLARREIVLLEKKLEDLLIQEEPS